MSDAGFPQNAAEDRVLLALCTARDYPHQYASQCLNEFSNGVRQIDGLLSMLFTELPKDDHLSQSNLCT